MNTVYDIIVIGAGPVGSYTACLLAKEGFHVGIFEKNSDIGKNINCTGLISLECFKQFDLPTDTIARSIHAIKAISPSGNFLRYQGTAPLAYIVRRTMFDREMNSMAEKAGAVLHLNSGGREIAVTRDAFSIKTGRAGKESTRRPGGLRRHRRLPRDARHLPHLRRPRPAGTVREDERQ